MKKRIILILTTICLAVVALLTVVACSGTESVAPKDLKIEAEDKKNVPIGEYALEYKILNYEKYKNEYQLKITVNVYDESLNSVEVKNTRSINVQSDKTYSVSVLVSGIADGETFVLAEQFYVEAKKADIVVKFLLPNNIIVEKKYVKHGGSLKFDDFPEIPDFYNTSDEDFSDLDDEEMEEALKELIESIKGNWGYADMPAIKLKKWVVYEKEGADPTDITEKMLENLTSDVTIYGYYEYEDDTTPHVLTYETNGGSAVESFNGNSTTVIPYPEEPKKEGHSFMYWCLDAELKIPFDWTRESVLYKDLTLYAKWAENLETTTHDKYFIYTFYEHEDYYGYSFYTIKAREAFAISGELILPNTYNGYPIRGMEEDAFRGSRITSVYIPNTYDLGTEGAFAECLQLKTVTFQEGSELYMFGSEMFYACTELETITIPDSVKIVSDSAFSCCRKLKTVQLPKELYMIEQFAFYECELLTEITIPDTTEVIDTKAFGACTYLETVNISANSKLNTLGDNIFYATMVFELTLPYRLKNTTAFEGSIITVTFHPKPEENDEDGTEKDSDEENNGDETENSGDENNGEEPNNSGEVEN